MNYIHNSENAYWNTRKSSIFTYCEFWEVLIKNHTTKSGFKKSRHVRYV